MDEIKKTTNYEIETEVHQIRSAFNKSLNADIEQKTNVKTIPVLPKRITIGMPTRVKEITFECISNDETAQLVFGSVALYYTYVNAHQNEYGESKLKEISEQFPRLTEFLNQYELNKSKFKIIKDFETYLVDKGFSGKGATRVISFINYAKRIPSLNAKQTNILLAIESATKLNPIESEQKSLVDWFLSINWLGSKMAQDGKSDVFQRLSSARFLMQSFNQTVAELMLILQEVSRDLTDTLKRNDFNVAIVKSTITDKDKTFRKYKFQKEILYSVTRMTHSVEKQTLEVLVHDFCLEENKNYVVTTLGSNRNLILKKLIDKKTVFTFCKAIIFDDSFINQLDGFLKGEQTSYPVSKAEEICFYWLNCSQTVQASDARKLRYEDYIFYGSAKKITHLSCDYWKSRAHDFKTTDTLDTKLPAGKALLTFLQNRKSVDELMSITSTDANKAPFCSTGSIGKMLTLMSGGTCLQRVKKGLQQQQVSTLFLSLIQCLFNNYEMTLKRWMNIRIKQGHDDTSIYTYRKLVANWIHPTWFTGSMIKTAAVHAKSKYFRVGALVNNNSHMGSTEHDVYFSEQNLEHKNTAARLLRFVMEDIENVAFKPNIEEIQKKITERQIRTQLISETSGNVQPFDSIDKNKEPTDTDIEGDAIRVIDSVETVVNFLHYIKEAEKHYKVLATHNPIYLEKHVLVEAEWKEYVLNNLISKQIKTKGFVAYEQYKPMLPNLFLSQIRV
ncbi:hypothetical protein [Candidatus Colwellia aromaticivorans]|uniref:hypothetical protein n=1 Tax=Candidatus Colwellia aromaticivorans TaxID=2267621 RepID=UPI000DF2F86D|nr:hypothetical protein [Candidatus Colwellia aromaticivorans]